MLDPLCTWAALGTGRPVWPGAIYDLFSLSAVNFPWWWVATTAWPCAHRGRAEEEEAIMQPVIEGRKVSPEQKLMARKWKTINYPSLKASLIHICSLVATCQYFCVRAEEGRGKKSNSTNINFPAGCTHWLAHSDGAQAVLSWLQTASLRSSKLTTKKPMEIIWC